MLHSFLRQTLSNLAFMQIDSLSTTASGSGAQRPGAVSDVINLFAHFGAASAAVAYQEIHSDAAAEAAARRWPLVAEWLTAAGCMPGRPD